VKKFFGRRINFYQSSWRKFIEIDAYKDWKTFVASVENILREFGGKYVINFV